MKRLNSTHAAFFTALFLHGLIMTAGIRPDKIAPAPSQRISVRLLPVAKKPAPSPVHRPETLRPPVPQRGKKVETPPPPLLPLEPKPEKLLSKRLAEPVRSLPESVPEPAPPEPVAEPVPVTPNPPVESPPVEMVADPVPAPPNPLKSDLQPTAHAQRLSDYLKGLQQLVKKNTEYPSAARRLNQQGVVLVQVRIRTNGELGEITVLRSSGYVSLDRAAVAALRRSAPFQAPAGFGLGDVLLDVPINFRLL